MQWYGVRWMLNLRIDIPKRKNINEILREKGYRYDRLVTKKSNVETCIVRELSSDERDGAVGVFFAKIFDIEDDNWKWNEKCRNEIHITNMLQENNHIVRLHDQFEVATFYILLFRYYEQGDLHGYVQEKKKKNENIPVPQVLEWIRDIAIILKSTKTHRVLHNDLKSSNILLDDNLHPVLCDFGSAMQIIPKDEDPQAESDSDDSSVGTLGFMSPEMRSQTKKRYLTMGSDVWSLGALFYEVANSRTPRPGTFSLETTPISYKETNLNYGNGLDDILSEEAPCYFYITHKMMGGDLHFPLETVRTGNLKKKKKFEKSVRKSLIKKKKHQKNNSPNLRLTHPSHSHPNNTSNSSKEKWLLRKHFLPACYPPTVKHLFGAMVRRNPMKRPSIDRIIRVLSEALEQYQEHPSSHNS